MPVFPPAVQALLARQDNVITRAQLIEHGMSYPTIRWNAWLVGDPAPRLRHHP